MFEVKYEYFIVIYYVWVLNIWCLFYNIKVLIFIICVVVFNFGLVYCVISVKIILFVCSLNILFYILRGLKLFNE